MGFKPFVINYICLVCFTLFSHVFIGVVRTMNIVSLFVLVIMSLKAIRLLRSCNEINSAKTILYDIFIEEMKWSFNPKSPTKFHIQHSSDGKKMLCDVFDLEAIWGGIYTGKQLVGTCRILTRENNLGKLDLELYDTKRIPFLAKMNTPCIEFQRAAVQKKYRGTGKIYPLFVLFSLEYAKKRDLGEIAVPQKHLQNALLRYGFETLHNDFYYGESKGEKGAAVMFCSRHKVEDAIGAVKAILGS